MYSFQDAPPAYDGGVPAGGLALDQSGAFYGTTSHSFLNGRNDFHVLQPVTHPQVALRVLYDDFRLAVNRQHFRGLRLIQPRDMSFDQPII
jgi:hypothetical protein